MKLYENIENTFEKLSYISRYCKSIVKIYPNFQYFQDSKVAFSLSVNSMIHSEFSVVFQVQCVAITDKDMLSWFERALNQLRSLDVVAASRAKAAPVPTPTVARSRVPFFPAAASTSAESGGGETDVQIVSERQQPMLSAPPATGSTPKQARNIQCPECPARLSNEGELRAHFAYNLPRSGPKQLVCAQCKAVYFSQCSFSAHKRSHKPQSQATWVCPECGMRMDQREFKTHIMDHRFSPTVLDAWRCMFCSAFYTTIEDLKVWNNKVVSC